LNSRKNTYIFFRLCHDDFCWSHSVQAVVTENAQRLNHPRSFEQIYLSTCNEKVHLHAPWAPWSDEDERTAVKLQNEGQTYPEIAGVLGRTIMSYWISCKCILHWSEL
jgi:hypothetical protein